jgi:hypothetical protein
MGVPHGGILAGVVLVTAIIQVPGTADHRADNRLGVFRCRHPARGRSSPCYMLAVALSDNVLKPLLLGRGVDLPALVVLIGALGGMVKFGIIGLFLGAVIVGHRLRDYQ